MALQFQKIQGKGWKSLTTKLCKKDDLDLLELVDYNPRKYPFLLESSSRGNKRNRFSILFYKPKFLIKKEKENNVNFLNEFDRLWKSENLNQEKTIINKKTIPFTGGWFVYLGYEMASEVEPKLKIPKSPFAFPTAFAARVKSAIIFDHIDREFFIISEDSEGWKEDFKEIEDHLNFKKKKNKKKKTSGSVEILTRGSIKEHQEQVRACIEYIYQGEIFQANLSRLWSFKIKNNLSEIEIYKQLRKKNPSPFSGLVIYEDSSIISSSPERLVSVEGNLLQTRPIAGTRPRGFSGLTDIELSKELINSSKEKAEHLMLVDLERNDISRVCKPGTVSVDEMMIIESYAHVHHIVSNICGKKLKNITPGKIISAVFPGGTITGCPKVRCMEILGELERVGRGPYTGSFGYITHSGNMDLNILIRSILKENNKLFVRAGGGIVADSIPENETLETEAKANGMLRAIGSFKK